ncbi:RNA polymerase sigma factor [Lignipirellula cremea]|uniref:RNA polymerase sigma factor n=1 Tax=Lignipirellula cremea TaxID=2528010 RepID=A0A518DLB1_9BACT|nr:RNA polymerase sigma factor [Lignipirellula cremea]
MNEQLAWPSDQWMAALAAGDSAVQQEFWNRYAGPLHRIADRQLSQKLKRRVDPEDVVQSACRTFFRRVGEGEFDLADQNDVWRLMLTITLNKARMQARFHGRDRRRMDREQALPEDPGQGISFYEEGLAEVDFSDFLDALLRRLSEEQQAILKRTLESQTQDEIAAAIGCSQRTVRRMQGRIRELLREILQQDLELGESESPSPS